MTHISLQEGDITAAETDAIVNAANSSLWMGAGVAGAIKRAGGQEIEQEAIKQGPIPVGEAVVTGSGRLKTRFVIHAAVMGTDLVTDADKIKSATQNSLLRAEELNLRSISFPALGTGVGGLPYTLVAESMISAVNDHLLGQGSLREVVFVLYSAEACAAFEEALARAGGGSQM